jgi:hypothetical protein
LATTLPIQNKYKVKILTSTVFLILVGAEFVHVLPLGVYHPYTLPPRMSWIRSIYFQDHEQFNGNRRIELNDKKEFAAARALATGLLQQPQHAAEQSLATLDQQDGQLNGAIDLVELEYYWMDNLSNSPTK